jgi:hypothetical protein
MVVIARCAAAALIFAAPATHAHDTAGCEAYTWDLARELAALRAPPKNVDARVRLPLKRRWLAIGKHYTATLVPQPSVVFASPPARARDPGNASAGLLFFRSGKAGRYRISLASRHWIDVLDGGTAIDSVGHEGKAGCALLHKVVEFELPANRALTLQLSGADSKDVHLVITGPA